MGLYIENYPFYVNFQNLRRLILHKNHLLKFFQKNTQKVLPSTGFCFFNTLKNIEIHTKWQKKLGFKGS